MGRKKKEVNVEAKRAKKKGGDDGTDVTVPETQFQLPSPLELDVHVLPIAPVAPPLPEGNDQNQIGNGATNRKRKRKGSVTIKSKAKKNKLTDRVPDPPESEPVVLDSEVDDDTEMPKNLSDLPNETVKHILSFLDGDVEGLKSARLVAKAWEQFTTPIFRKSHPEISFTTSGDLIKFVKEVTRTKRRQLNLAGGFPYSKFKFDMFPIRNRVTHDIFTKRFGPFVSELCLIVARESANLRNLEKMFMKAQDLVEGMTNLKVLKIRGDTGYGGENVNLPDQANPRTVQLPSLERMGMNLYFGDQLFGEMCARFLEGATNLKVLEIDFNEGSLCSKLPRILNVLQNISNMSTTVGLRNFGINQFRASIASLDVMISMSAWLKIHALEFQIIGFDSDENRNVQRELDTFTRFLASQSANLEVLSMSAYGIKDPNFVHQLPYLQALKKLTFNWNHSNKFQNFETLLPENVPGLESITLEGYSDRCNLPLLIADNSFPTVQELNLEYKRRYKHVFTPWDQIFPNLTTLTLNSAKTAQLEFVIKKMTNLVNLTVELEYDGGDLVAVLSGLHKPMDVYLKFFKEVYQMDDFDGIFDYGAHVIEVDGKEGLDKLVSFLSKEQLAYRLPGLRGMKRLKKFVLNQKFKSIEDYGAFLSFFEVNPIEKLIIAQAQMSEPCRSLVYQYHSKLFPAKEEVEIGADGTDNLELDCVVENRTKSLHR